MSSKNSPKRKRAKKKFFDIKAEARKYYPSKKDDRPIKGGVPAYAFVKVHGTSRRSPNSIRLSII